MRQLNREGASFRRQVAIDDYVFDFGEFRARLLVELDGAVHRLDDVVLRDAKKSEYANAQGFRLLRLTNSEVWSAPDAVFDKLRAALSAASPPGPHSDSPPPLAPPRKGEGNA